MTSTYELDLDQGVDDLPTLDIGTPAGQAIAWWLDRVRRHAYVDLRDALPDAAVTRVLRDRELIAEVPGEWAFAVRTPGIDADTALRRNVWALVAAAIRRYAPAVIDRTTAVRLYSGDEAIRSPVHIRHAANESKHTLRIVKGLEIELTPDEFIGQAPSTDPTALTTVTVGTAPAISLPVLGAATLLTTLTPRDIRENLDTILAWLRTAVVGRAPLENSLTRSGRTVVLKRMGDLARDTGNIRLADTIDEVVAAQTKARISRTKTGVGIQFVVPRYISAHPTASSPWLERHRVRLERALETVPTLVARQVAEFPRLNAEGVIAIAREAKAEDTYHSTTIEGYRITRDEVRAVMEGKAHEGRTPEETERRMALLGYARAFDLTLARIGAASPPEAQPQLSEDLIFDLFLELWGPSIDAGIVEARRDWRNTPVHINDSSHVPPAPEKLRGLMTQYVTIMNASDVDPVSRAIVAHWQFVHLHPFRDGNGRISRLLMNYALSAAGLPWTTIRAEERKRYFGALEEAHMNENFAPFAAFVLENVARSSETYWRRA